MLVCNSLLKLSAIATVLLMGVGVGEIPGSRYTDSAFASERVPQLAQGHVTSEPQGRSLSRLADGDFQFCSQPEPTDWHQGAGVCLTFRKSGSHIEGYYGYPHSDQFICVQGEVNENLVMGEAFTISWPGDQWEDIPTSAFEWDEEAHLTLAQGERIHPSAPSHDPAEWILFHRAVLDVDGFYQYRSPRMTPASELCNFPGVGQ